DPRDATSARIDVPDFTAGLEGGARGLRVGVPWRFLAAGVDEGITGAFRAAIDALRSAGAAVVDVDLPHAPHAIATYYLVATAEASSNLARFDGVRYGFRAAGDGANDSVRTMYARARGRGFGAEVKRRIMLGTYVLRARYHHA